MLWKTEHGHIRYQIKTKLILCGVECSFTNMTIHGCHIRWVVSSQSPKMNIRKNKMKRKEEKERGISESVVFYMTIYDSSACKDVLTHMNLSNNPWHQLSLKKNIQHRPTLKCQGPRMTNPNPDIIWWDFSRCVIETVNGGRTCSALSLISLTTVHNVLSFAICLCIQPGLDNMPSISQVGARQAV